MKKVIDDERVILRICDLYYNHDMKQSDIAKELGLSRPTVSRMIGIAKEKGIVKIIISDLNGRNYFELERRLEEKFGLNSVIIVNKKMDDYEQKDEIGKAAADFLERIIKEGNTIGISMGTTLTHIPKFVDSKIYYRKLTFVPLIGGVGYMETELHSNHIVENMSRSFGGKSILFHAPAIVSRHATKEALLNEDSVQKVFDKAENLDIAVVGIGSLESYSTILQAGYYNTQMMTEVKKSGGVGDICMRFFDEEGDVSKFEINNNVVGINLRKLQNIPYSIGVAGGTSKVKAIMGALKGHFINVLITDEECAEQLYRMDY